MKLVKLCGNCGEPFTGRTWNRRYCSSFCAAPFPTWVAGWNLASYLPDPDNLAVFARWEDAREYLRGCLTSWRDSLECEYTDDFYANETLEQCADSLDTATQALDNLIPNMGGQVVVRDRQGHLWPHFISQSTERPEDY